MRYWSAAGLTVAAVTMVATGRARAADWSVRTYHGDTREADSCQVSSGGTSPIDLTIDRSRTWLHRNGCVACGSLPYLLQAMRHSPPDSTMATPSSIRVGRQQSERRQWCHRCERTKCPAYGGFSHAQWQRHPPEGERPDS